MAKQQVGEVVSWLNILLMKLQLDETTSWWKCNLMKLQVGRMQVDETSNNLLSIVKNLTTRGQYYITFYTCDEFPTEVS